MRLVRWSAPALVALAFFPHAGLADEGSMTTRDLDAQVEKATFQAIAAGVKVDNGGDAQGCYRIYQGSLTALGPVLAHRPDLQAAVQKGLAGAEAGGTSEQRAFALRAVLDTVRSRVLPTNTATLWSRLGGEPAVKALVHDFVVKAANDPRVDFTRGGRYPLDAAGVALVDMLLVRQISSISGDPPPPADPGSNPSAEIAPP